MSVNVGTGSEEMQGDPIPDDLRHARAVWLGAEAALESATRPFFESGLLLTEERREMLRAKFESRDKARANYDHALKLFFWPNKNERQE
jgi:hypothetical protein